MSVFEKIMKVGQPLGDFVERKFFVDVTTGLNEAFVIDSKTRRALIAKDKKSTHLIKRLLSGEDIRRWVFRQKDTWLIFARRGVDIDSYPAVEAAHLSKWKAELTPKKNSSTGSGANRARTMDEIQDDVAYYPTFESPKILFPDIGKGPSFVSTPRAITLPIPDIA